MGDTIKRSDQICLLEACAELEKTGIMPGLFTYPNCGWDLVQQGLVTPDRKLTMAGKAALWLLEKGEDPTEGGSSISISISAPQTNVLTEDGWAYVAPAIGGGTTSREWQRKFPSLWHAVSAASQDLLVAADLVRNKEVKARLMLHWDTVNGIAHALNRYARQPHSSVNQPDVNAPSLLEQGRLEEPRQLDQGMTSTSGDAQTSYPPVDCLNGIAREQLAREGSCNASSLERSGSIDAEVDNTTVPGTPSSQTRVGGER